MEVQRNGSAAARRGAVRKEGCERWLRESRERERGEKLQIYEKEGIEDKYDALFVVQLLMKIKNKKTPFK